MSEESNPQKSIRDKILRLIIISISTYTGVCLLLTFLQAKLIYFPTRGYTSTPTQIGIDYDSVILQTDDKVNITAWYVPHPNPRATIIFCHGNAGNNSDRLFDIKQFHRAGYNVFIFDYRGYGESEGTPSEIGTYLDAEAAWRYLIEEKKESPERIILFGRSLGGAVAIELAMRHMPAALIVESSFASLEDVGRMHYPFLPVRLILSYRYDSIKKVPHLSCPKLFIHGLDDRLIPIEQGRKLFDASSNPKMFMETPGEHNTSGYSYSPTHTNQMLDFMEQSLVTTR